MHAKRVDIQVPSWSAKQVRRFIEKLLPELEQGGVMFGALEKDLLVGIAVLGNRFIGENQSQLQLVFLHVSNGYRRQEVATRLLSEVRRLAKERGASQLYISATESESAVGFYLSQGAKLAEKVDQELYALEPEDIHLTLDL